MLFSKSTTVQQQQQKKVLKATQCHFMTNNKVSQGKLAISCHGKISQKDLSFFSV